jgi:hypothetical protein
VSLSPLTTTLTLAGQIPEPIIEWKGKDPDELEAEIVSRSRIPAEVDPTQTAMEKENEELQRRMETDFDELQARFERAGRGEVSTP